MEIKLTTSEIRAILQGCQYTLRLVGSSRDYRKIQSSEHLRSKKMTLTLDNHSKTRESSLTQALRQIQELNSKIAQLEQQH